MASLTEQLLKGQQIQTNQSGNTGSLTEQLMQQQMSQQLPSETSLPKSSNGILERLKGVLPSNPVNAPRVVQDRISQGSPIQLSNAPKLATAHTTEIPKQSEIAQGLQSGGWNSAIGKFTQSKYNPTSPQNMVSLGEFVSSKLPDGKVKDYVDSRTGAYEEQGQRVADLQSFNPNTIAGKAAQVAGTIGGDLPLWATGYGTVGQAVTKVPQVARLGKLSQEAVRGASVGATVSPIESAVHGDDAKQALQRAALNIGAGAVLDPAMMKLGSIISNAIKAKPTATIDEIVEAVAKETNVPTSPELVKQVEDTIKLLPAPQNFTGPGLPNPNYIQPVNVPKSIARTPFDTTPQTVDLPNLKPRQVIPEPQPLIQAETVTTALKEPVDIKPFKATAESYPYNEAKQAFSWNSMDPERAAKVRQDGYVAYMDDVYNDLSKTVKSPEQQRVLDAEMAKFNDRFLAFERESIAKRSRVASPMVTGPAKFPTARNEKALNAEHTHMGKFIEWKEKSC